MVGLADRLDMTIAVDLNLLNHKPNDIRLLICVTIVREISQINLM